MYCNTSKRFKYLIFSLNQDLYLKRPWFSAQTEEYGVFSVKMRYNAVYLTLDFTNYNAVKSFLAVISKRSVKNVSKSN